MKKLSLLMAALLFIVSLAACGKTTNPTGNSANNASSGNNQASSGNDNASSGTTNSTKDSDPEKAMTPGKLNYINLKDGEEPVLKGLRMDGNRSGAGETYDGQSVNFRPASTDNIRCIFELNEWVEIYPDTEKTTGMRVWAFEHREDQTSYEKLTFSEEAEGYVASADLEKPEEENWQWGAFYLLGGEVKTGYYDIVFTFNGKACASVLTRFYNDGELQEKTDPELEEIMKGLEPLTVK